MAKGYLMPDRPGDDGNTKTLKHGVRWGVANGALDPNDEQVRQMWRDLDGGRDIQAVEIPEGDDR